MWPAPFQAFPLRSREQSELILSAALLSSLTLFHVQLRGKCPHSEAKAPIIIENPGSICVRAGSGPKIRQSKINSSLVAGPMGQMNRRPSV